MKTLFIVSLASGYGGAERSIEVVLRHLPADIQVYVFAEHPEHIAQLSRAGMPALNVRLIRCASTASLAGKRIAALRLSLEYRRRRPHRILLNTQRSALIAAMAAKYLPGLGRRSHLYVRDFLWTDLDYIFQRLSGARVLVPSSVVLERCGYLYPLYLAQDGASAGQVVPDMAEIASGGCGYECSYEGPLLHLATINPWKGHMDLIMATQRLQSQQRKVVIESRGIVGDTALRQRLLRLIDRLGLGDRFILADYTPDPAGLLRSCRAVVVASVSHSGGPETFGRTVIEAWACRKPVVAYAAGAVGRMVRDGVDGLLVAEGDIDALAAALYRLSDSPELCQRLGEAGHARVLACYEAGSVTRRMLDQLLSPEVA